MKTFCTSAEAAKMLGVALRTVQLWSETGLLEAWKTSGGHRRIHRESVQRLLMGQNKRASDRLPVAESATSAPLHILVVEDDAVLRHLYEIQLRRWPMQPVVNTSGDGYDALIRLGRSKPDLLILDLSLPGMDGFRMLQTIHETPALAGMNIVVVSGLDPAEIQLRGGVPPGVRLLPKPIPFQELQALAEQITRPTLTGAQTP